MKQANIVSIEPQHEEGLYQCTWADIGSPGAYVEMDSGDLYRIPQESLGGNATLIIRKESQGASRMARISNDPYITTLEARFISCEHNITPNF
jgi:hypothetical protein